MPVEPRLEPGLVRRLDGDYFSRISAIEFAVKYDDGKDPRGMLLADVVLVGVSRTSKTPLSMYLAHKQIKAKSWIMRKKLCALSTAMCSMCRVKQLKR